MVHHAAMAIASGQCSTVLCVAGQNLLSNRQRAHAVKQMAESGGAHPQFEAPYIIALIALDEGPHLMSRIVAPEKAKLAIGARVAVEFEDADEEISLPVFRIIDA